MVFLNSQFRKQYQKGTSESGSFSITILSPQSKCLCLDIAMFLSFFLSMNFFLNVHNLGLQDSFSGIQRKSVFIIKPSKTEKCIFFCTIHIIFLFSLFSTLRYKYCACSQICMCTKQTESILKPMKYLLF